MTSGPQRPHGRDVLRYAAFADDPRLGNPAGVVLAADGMSEEQMQSTAAKVGYSETAFLVRRGPVDYRVRYFTPRTEIPFCGHATIAAGVALAERGSGSDVSLSTAAGPVAVRTTVVARRVVASLRSPPIASTLMSGDVRDTLLRVLGWRESRLHPSWPPHVGHAGQNRHPILHVRHREQLAQLTYLRDPLSELMAVHGWTTVSLLWRAPDGLIHSRNPAPVLGIDEDPATGSAAAALAGYLLTLGKIRNRHRFTVIQGEDMGRRSHIDVQACSLAGEQHAVVSGTAVRIS